MRRRNFVKTTALSSALLMTPGLFSTLRAMDLKKQFGNLIDPIIPFEFYPHLEKEMISYIIDLKKRYGFRRFLITGPTKESRYTGFPEKKVFSDLAEQILSIKHQLAGYDIEIGWWCVTTIRIGNGRFQGIIKEDGKLVKESPCPLDPKYRDLFSDYVATVVQIARPFWINFEDDYHLSGGCFCPLHLEEFSKRQNRNYSREELQTILHANTPESYRIRLAWGELKRDSLAGLATSVRAKVDRIAPETRLCLCQNVYGNENDGNCTEAVTKAFAGKTRPVVRVQGTSYFSDNPLDIPQSVFNCLYQKQNLPSDFELIHEADSFPHTRFFMSAAKLKSLMTSAFTYGLDDSLLYTTQYLENPLEEEGYSKMFKAQSNRFSALKTAVKECRVEGCEIFRKPGTSSCWAGITGRLGIPHTALGGTVKLVSGDIIAGMNEDQITHLLKGSVFLDGLAAYELSKRGYNRMIGAEITPREEAVLPPFYEGIRNPKNYENINNRLMYNYDWAFNSENKNSFYQINPLATAEIVTDFLNSKNEPSHPGIIRFENELGGRIAIMAFNLNDSFTYSRSIAIFNYSKKELIRQLIQWLGKEPLPVFVKYSPNTFCAFNRSKSNDYAIITLINLCSDSFDSISLDVAPEWINSKIEILNKDGVWHPAGTDKLNHTIKVNTTLSLMDPVILKFIK
jgi:hypothetical protein